MASRAIGWRRGEPVRICTHWRLNRKACSAILYTILNREDCRLTPLFALVNPCPALHWLPGVRDIAELLAPGLPARTFEETKGDTRGGHSWEEYRYFREGDGTRGFCVEHTTEWSETFLDDYKRTERLQIRSYGLNGGAFVSFFYDPVFAFANLKHCVRLAVHSPDKSQEAAAYLKFRESLGAFGVAPAEIQEVRAVSDLDFLMNRFRTLFREPLDVSTPDGLVNFLERLDGLESDPFDARGRPKFLDYYHDLFVWLGRAAVLRELGRSAQSLILFDAVPARFYAANQPWALIDLVKAWVLSAGGEPIGRFPSCT